MSVKMPCRFFRKIRDLVFLQQSFHLLFYTKEGLRKYDNFILNSNQVPRILVRHTIG